MRRAKKRGGFCRLKRQLDRLETEVNAAYEEFLRQFAKNPYNTPAVRDSYDAYRELDVRRLRLRALYEAAKALREKNQI